MSVDEAVAACQNDVGGGVETQIGWANRLLVHGSRCVRFGCHCVSLLFLVSAPPAGISASSVCLCLVLSTGVCLCFFLVGLLLLLLRHDILEHGPQSFDLTEFVADLFRS